MRRFTRPTSAFSKKLENHAHMVALYALWYNFIRVHKTLRMSPAMAAGIETRLWSMKDVVRLIEWREDMRSGALLVGSGYQRSSVAKSTSISAGSRCCAPDTTEGIEG